MVRGPYYNLKGTAPMRTFNNWQAAIAWIADTTDIDPQDVEEFGGPLTLSEQQHAMLQAAFGADPIDVYDPDDPDLMTADPLPNMGAVLGHAQTPAPGGYHALTRFAGGAAIEINGCSMASGPTVALVPHGRGYHA